MFRAASWLLVALLAAGCASRDPITESLAGDARDTQSSAPLGGESLLQRKIELDRAVRDLRHCHATLTSLNRRGERGPTAMFREYVDAYIAQHVLPLLHERWQSRHPELAGLDANARLLVAELWSLMGRPGRTEDMIDDLRRRYAGRGSMIVAYPVGEQGTLADGIEHLRDL